MKPRIIVHGGARKLEQDEPERKVDVIKACETAYEVLCKKSALDAVETAIIEMESSEFLNAGVGSFLQIDGRVRMDASIMTDDYSAGAVIGIEDVEHPIAVARRVMESTKHIILAGKLATECAHSEGFPRYDPRTKEKIDLWWNLIEELRAKTSYEQIFHVDKYINSSNKGLGTVGCVAIDKQGKMAAGTSTGGMRITVPGRVGDSPIIGAGTYCSPYGAVSCTGVGEKILAVCLANSVVTYMKFNPRKKAADAARYGIEELSGIAGHGGLICINKKGDIGYALNTETMTFHYID